MASRSPLQIEHSLKNLGFSKNETKVLLFLFQCKTSTSLDISKNVILPFTTVQFVLSGLERRGLVNLNSVGDEDIYTVCSQKEFNRWVDEQREKHDVLYKEAQRDIGNFFEFVEEHSWQPTVQYFEGVAGIKEIYEDMLDQESPLYSWIDLVETDSILGDYMMDFIDRRVEAGIETFAIMPENRFNKMHDPKEQEKRIIKWKRNLPLNGEIRIYSQKVAFMTFDGDKPVGFMINSPLISKLFKAVFDSQWNSD